MKRALSLLLCIFILLSFSSCKKEEVKVESHLKLSDVTSPVVLHTKTQQAYIDCDDPAKVFLFASNEDDTSPAPLNLKWEWTGEKTPESYIVYISETPDFTDFIQQFSRRTNTLIYNLKLGTTYYWKVVADLGDKKEESETKKFTTEDGEFRFILCDGITNMRDIGGHTTEDGKRVKQGLIFRCSRLNENKTNDRLISDNGLSVMRDLGIMFELDLRGDSEAFIERSFIENAKYKRIPVKGEYKSGNYYEKNDEVLRQIFACVSDESNFPMIIHCSVGTDRTGFTCYTLEGLLGVKKETLLKDYLFSDFSRGFSPGSRTLDYIANDYVAGYDAEEGSTLSEKVENHLLKIGVTKEQIDKFKEIMLE